MTALLDHQTARALLEWQVELGVTETIGEEPVNRFEAEDVAPARAAFQGERAGMAAGMAAGPAGQADATGDAPGNATGGASAPGPTGHVPMPQVDPVAEARSAAMAATSLEALAQAQAGFEHCELKKGARNFVFADGKPGARVMVLGEAPGRDEDHAGKPFVGQAGQMLDRMLDAIGLSRTAEDLRDAVYIANVLPWRPPGNRAPHPGEVAMMMPFVEKHVALAAPEFLVLMGNVSCQACLGQKGITRLRGQWTQALGRPALPMVHPAYLLRTPEAKRDSWADLLDLRARLDTAGDA